MSCLINTGNFNKDIFGCEFFAGGITRLWVGNFQEDLTNKLVVVNNQVQSINGAIKFVEIPHNAFDNDTATYKETYDIENKKYDLELSFDIVGMTGDRRLEVDKLTKGEFVFAWKDWNGRYFLSFYEEPGEIKEAIFNTGQRKGKNEYSFIYESTQNLPAIELQDIGVLDNIDCNELNNTINTLDSNLRVVGQFLECELSVVNTFSGDTACP